MHTRWCCAVAPCAEDSGPWPRASVPSSSRVRLRGGRLRVEHRLCWTADPTGRCGPAPQGTSPRGLSRVLQGLVERVGLTRGALLLGDPVCSGAYRAPSETGTINQVRCGVSQLRLPRRAPPGALNPLSPPRGEAGGSMLFLPAPSPPSPGAACGWRRPAVLLSPGKPPLSGSVAALSLVEKQKQKTDNS